MISFNILGSSEGRGEGGRQGVRAFFRKGLAMLGLQGQVFLAFLRLLICDTSLLLVFNALFRVAVKDISSSLTLPVKVNVFSFLT